MKKHYLYALTLLIMVSCTKQPKCDNEEALKLAKDLIKQELGSNENLMAFAFFGMSDKSKIDTFVDNNIELINVRTTEKNDELKKCECASHISFKFSEEFKSKMENIGKKDFIGSILNEILNKQFEYNYTLQIINKEEELFIEGYVPTEDLKGIFTNYLMFNTSSEEDETRDLDENSLDEDNQQKTQVDSINKNETNIIPNSGEIITSKSYIYKDRKFSSKTKMYLIKGDVFDIGENKDGFYDIHYKGVNYDKNIEGYIPENEIKLLYLDKYGNKTYIN